MYLSGIICVALASTNLYGFIERRIDNFSREKCLCRFSDYPPGAGKLGFPRCLWEKPFPANPNFWLKGVDFTCASPWNDAHGCQRAGTAISKRHIIYANHFPLTKGTRIAFVGETGEVSHYTLKSSRTIGDTDITIGLLDYELTPDVHPAKVLPEGFAKWLKAGTMWPAVKFTQREQAYLSEIRIVDDTTCAEGVRLVNRACSTSSWLVAAGSIARGDSGNPSFLLYQGRPILVYCLYSGSIGFGPMIHEHRKEVQRAMDELCPGYKLEEFDFEKAVKAEMEQK